MRICNNSKSTRDLPSITLSHGCDDEDVHVGVAHILLQQHLELLLRIEVPASIAQPLSLQFGRMVQTAK